jgi:hypothetical protein
MEKRDDFYIPEEIAEWIGLKKSEYLSKVIMLQLPDDLSFEDYPRFDSFIPETIEKPDRIFESEEDDQVIRTYVKTYPEQGEFHQLVIGVLLDDQEKKANVFIPILTVVSRKDELIREFSKGKELMAPTLN